MLEINILCLPLHIRYNPECEDQRENLQINNVFIVLQYMTIFFSHAYLHLVNNIK